MLTRIVVKKRNGLNFYIALFGLCAILAPCIANAATFSVTSTTTGTGAGGLSNSITLANGTPGNTIEFNINAAVLYNVAMPAITNLPMTIDGNNNAALRLRTTAAATPLFNVTGALNPGTLTLTNMLSGLPILQSDTNVDLGNTVEFNQLNTGTYGTNASNISGQGAVRLTLSGAGTTVTFTTANTYTGDTTFTSGGTFIAGNNSALGVGGLVTFGTGTIQSNATRTLANPFTISAPAFLGGANNLTLSGTVNLNANTLTSTNTATTTLSGVVSGLGGTIEVDAPGVGALVLSGANTYTGGTFVTAGTVRVNNTTGLGTGTVFMNGGILRSGVTLTIANNYVLGADSFIGGTNNLTITGTGDLGTSNLTITNTATTTLTGVISDTSSTGSITVSAVTGDLILTAANTYGGGTTLTVGTLHIGDNNALGSGPLTLNGGAMQATVALTNPVPNNFTVTAPSTLNGNRSFTMGGQGTLGSTLAVANTGASIITLAGNISGAGSITKSAGGTLAINGTNSYTGGTTMTAGTLSLGSNDALGGVGGGTLTMGGGSLQSSTTLNNIPNAFLLTANSTMNGSNSFKMVGNGDLDAFRLTVNNTAASTITLAGNIQDNGLSGGSILKNGVGILELNGTNTYGGGTTLNNGTLILGNNAALGTNDLTIDGATLQSNTALNNIQNNVILTAPSTMSGINDFAISGNVNLNNFRLTVANTSGSRITLDQVSGGALGNIRQNGAGGILVLSGNTTYGGGTIVNMGTLFANGTVGGSVTVNALGTLGGSGTIGGSVVNSGVVSSSDASGTPGVLGTLTILGNYTVNPSGTTIMQISPSGAVADIVVGGTASLNGALNVLTLPGNFVLGSTYVLLSAGSRLGTFSSFPTRIGNIIPTITYTPTEVILGLNYIALDVSGCNENQIAVGNYINSLTISGGDLAVTIGALGMLSHEQMCDALESISPGRLNASTVVLEDNAEFINKMTSSRLAALRSGTPEESYLVSAFNHTSKTLHNASHQTLNLLTPKFYNATHYGARRTTHQHFRHSFCSVDERSDVWINPFGRYSHADATNIDPRFDATTAGFAGGADHKFCNNLIVGFGVGYYRAWIAESLFPDRMRVNTAFATVYGTWYQEGFYLDASVVGGLTHYHATHNMEISSIRRTSTGTHRGGEIAPYIEFGRGYCINGIKVAPYISFNYIHIREQSYLLTGANSLDMNIQGKNANALYSEIGVRVSKTYALRYYLLTPEVALSYTNQRARNGNMVAGLIGLPGNFSVTNFSGNSYRISPAFGLLMKFYNGGFVKTYFSTEFGPRYQAYEFNILAGLSF